MGFRCGAMTFIHTDRDLEHGLANLLARDPRLAPVAARAGRFQLRRRQAGFGGLCAIVCGQQLSTASAAAIWERLAAAYSPFAPQALRRARTDRLARLGLSRPKIKAIKAIGAAIADGRIDLDELASLEAADARASLIALHGVGPWTAEIYLLFCLGHADAWPAGDLALQEAARIALDLATRPSGPQLEAIAESWRPWRGVAAHLLWAYYRAIKQREGAPVPIKSNGDARGR